MAVINTGLLTKGLRSEFFNRFEAAQTHFQDLSTRVVSGSDRETYRWLGTVPRVREWGTGRLAQGLRAESYSIENLKYEATIEVDRDEISDDQTGQIRLRVAELAQRAATHKDYLIAQLLLNGETAGNNGYDGVSFFNSSHISGASGNQSNLLTYDAQAADTPTVAEFKEALKAAIATMLAYRDDQGEPLLISAGSLVCVVPPTMLFTATEAINATIVNNTQNVMQGNRSRHRPPVADRRVQVVRAEDRRRGAAVHLPGSRAGRVQRPGGGFGRGLPPGEILLRRKGPVIAWPTATGSTLCGRISRDRGLRRGVAGVRRSRRMSDRPGRGKREAAAKGGTDRRSLPGPSAAGRRL